MAPGVLEDIQGTTGQLRRSLRQRTNLAKPHSPSTGNIALSVIGILAATGVAVAAVYFSPDLIRYMKIKRM